MKRESKEAPRVHESPEDDDESELAKFLSPEARKRYRALREGRLDVDAELTRIYDELEAEQGAMADRGRWVKRREGLDGFGRQGR